MPPRVITAQQQRTRRLRTHEASHLEHENLFLFACAHGAAKICSMLVGQRATAPSPQHHIPWPVGVSPEEGVWILHGAVVHEAARADMT